MSTFTELIPKGLYTIKVTKATFIITRMRGNKVIETVGEITEGPYKGRTVRIYSTPGLGTAEHTRQVLSHRWEQYRFPDVTGWNTAPRNVPNLVGTLFEANITVIEHPMDFTFWNSGSLRRRLD